MTPPLVAYMPDPVLYVWHTPMLVEDGRRLVISNLALQYLTQECANNLGTMTVLSRPGVELFRLLPDAHSTLTLAAAARMNASFPWVVPAGALPTDPVRHVVDAGYFDNFGTATAVSWVAENFELLAAKTKGVLLIQIRDAVVNEPRDLIAPPTKWLLRAWNFLAPIMGAILSAGTS